MRKMSRLVLGVFAVAIAVGVGAYAAPADACKCKMDDRPLEKVYMTALVDSHVTFHGKVVSSRNLGGKTSRVQTTFQVLTYYKGWPETRVVVESNAKARHMCDRAHKFEKGKSYLVFAKRDGKHFSVENGTTCQKMTTGPVPEGVALYKIFGRDKKPNHKTTHQDWKKLYQQLVERICPFGQQFVAARMGCRKEPCEFECSDDGRGTSGKKRMIGE